MCAAKCCENLTPSKEEVQQCMNRCFVPIQQIQEYLGKELSGFQVNRLLVWFGGDFLIWRVWSYSERVTSKFSLEIPKTNQVKWLPSNQENMITNNNFFCIVFFSLFIDCLFVCLFILLLFFMTE